jgi:hypothetical protein
VDIAESNGDDLLRIVLVRREAVGDPHAEQCLKAVDIESTICIKHNGDLVPATEAKREYAGTNKIVEEMCFSRA